MIVAHHPLLFRPPTSITSSDLTGSMILTLAKHDIAVYAAHTNLDAATGGVNFALAEAMNLSHIRFLAPLKDLYAKLAVFVPSSHVEQVMHAMAGAGAGKTRTSMPSRESNREKVHVRDAYGSWR